MASPGAILGAYKAIPGAGASPTPGPVSANAPYYGNYSPLSQQLANERGYANSYGGFLPRPPREFTEGAFGPFSPILPVPVDVPEIGAERPEARRWEYPVGWNLPVGVPGSEGLKLVPFAVLKSLSELYSVARTCIQIRKAEVRSLDWDIIPTHDAAKAYHGDHHAMHDFGRRRAQAVRFFKHPDPDYFSFGSWLDAILEEIFVYDALALLVRPKWGRGMGKGVLGSDLDSLQLISGPTIRPLVGIHGDIPRPPAPAYQQYLYGVPRSDYMTMITQRDIDEGDLRGSELKQYRGDQMLYLPMVPRRETPYGFPPIERALIPVMSGLQKQIYQLNYFAEGTVPAVYISPGDTSMTPNQIRELQDALNAFAGDPAWHHKIIVLPPNSKVDPQKPASLADQFDEMVMTQVTMAFDVNPMELGILPRVSAVASPFAAREMAQSQRSIHERLSTKPLLKFLCDIFDGILHRYMGQDDMKFTFDGLHEEGEQQALTSTLVQQVQNGIRSVDEARDQLELQPWGLPETSGPVLFTANGVIPFGPLPQQKGQPQQLTLGPGGALPPAAGAPPAGAPPAPAQAPTAGGPPAGAAAPPAAPAAAGGPPPPPGSPPPGGPGLTPLHTAARAGLGIGSARPGGGSPQENAEDHGSQAARIARQHAERAIAPELTKAAGAEVEALACHIAKGRDHAAWHPEHLEAWAPRLVADNLLTGTPVGDIKKMISAKASNPRRWWPGWDYDSKLAAVYAPKIRSAFMKAIRKAGMLIQQWWDGEVAATRDGLAHLISHLIERDLGRVLRKLWREAWFLGTRSARAAMRGTSTMDLGQWTPGTAARAVLGASNVQAFDALLASYGVSTIEAISATRMPDVVRAVSDAVSAGSGERDLAARLETLLEVPMRAEMIAQTEIARVMCAAALDVYKEAGVERKEWITAPGERVCAICRGNEAEGGLPLSQLFESGVPAPPAHPRCRCVVAPVRTSSPGPGIEGPVVKRERAVVGYSGSEGPMLKWTAPSPAGWGGGAPMPVPHDGNGIQQADPRNLGFDENLYQRPGTSADTDNAGGEPPAPDLLVDSRRPGTRRGVDTGGQVSWLEPPAAHDTSRWPSPAPYLAGGAPEGPAIGTSQPHGRMWSVPVGDDGDAPSFERGVPPSAEDITQERPIHIPERLWVRWGRLKADEGRMHSRVVVQAGDTGRVIGALPAQGVAGLVVRARDTGRVLMLQRALHAPEEGEEEA